MVFCLDRSIVSLSAGTRFETVEPAPTVAPFTYANLLWMTLFGYLLFSDLPDLWTISGACIVAGSGLYIFHRENKLGKDNARV